MIRKITAVFLAVCLCLSGWAVAETRACVHANTETREELDWSSRSYSSIDNEYHNLIAPLLRIVYCADCDTEISSTVIEANSRTKEHHNYAGDTCSDCGHRNSCSHTNAQVMEYPGNAVYTEIAGDAKNHTVKYERVEYTYCNDCHQEISDDRHTGEWITETEAHYFVNAVCVECGYTNGCRHPNAVVDTYLEPSGYEEIQGDHLYHNCVGQMIEYTYCGACDYYDEKKLDGKVTEKERHSYDGTTCAYCDHVNTCRHPNAEAESYIRNPVYTQVEGNGGYHSVSGQRVEYTYCNDCDEYASDVIYTDVKGEMEAHNWQGGKCTKCGYVRNPRLNEVGVSTMSAETGSSATWTADAEDGEGDLQYNYVLLKDGQMYENIGWRSESTLTYTFTQPGSYKLQVRAKDANGTRSEYRYSKTITVAESKAQPLTLKSVEVAQMRSKSVSDVTWVAEATGGAGNTLYNYVLLKDGKVYKNIGWRSENTLTYAFTEPGSYKLQVRAKDITEARSEYCYSKTIVIEQAAARLTLKAVSVSQTSAAVGESATWTSEATGGAGGTQYNYVLLKDGEVYRNIGWRSENRFTFTFTEPGSYRLQIRAKDATEARSEYRYSKSVVVQENGR